MWNFKEHLLHRTPQDDCFCMYSEVSSELLSNIENGGFDENNWRLKVVIYFWEDLHHYEHKSVRFCKRLLALKLNGIWWFPVKSRFPKYGGLPKWWYRGFKIPLQLHVPDFFSFCFCFVIFFFHSRVEYSNTYNIYSFKVNKKAL